MILVIGATSFIGVHLVTYLKQKGEKVVVTGRNNKFRDFYDDLSVPYYNLDLTKEEDFNLLPCEEIESVVLLGGLLPANIFNNSNNAVEYFEVNTIGTIRVLDYCRKNEIPRVIATTSYADVINSWSAHKRLNENEPRNFKYTGDHALYVFSKNAACDILEFYNQEYGMKNVYFRLPMVIGVGPHGSYGVDGTIKKSGFQTFLENAIEGKDIVIYGDEETIRDLVSVKDVVQAVYKASKSKTAQGLYNITAGRGITLKKQAEIMAEVFCKDNSKSKVKNQPEIKNSSKSFLFDITKAKNDFDYNPKYDDFRKMMLDYKKDYEHGLFNELFKYK